MKKLIIVVILSVFAIGCGNAARPVAQNANATTTSSPSEKPQTAIAHTLENQQPASDADSAGKSKWKQSGDPVDTKKFDTDIAAAEVAFKKTPDDAAKKALSGAYYRRGVVLTEARQYASALGDYRKAVKYDPANAEAKDWIDQIINIYDSMGRESPKEGEEPPPLQLNKSN